jgi:methyl-accepting chemotaxis protein
MSLLHRISLPGKFLLLGVIAVVMTAVPTAMHLTRSMEEMAVARLEDAGIGPAVHLQRIIRLTLEHRRAANRVLTGANSETGALTRAATDLGGAFTAFEADLQSHPAWAALRKDWPAHRQRWSALSGSLTDGKLDAASSFSLHSESLSSLAALNERLLDDSGIMLDPQADSYYLAMATLLEAPKLAEKLGRLRAQGNQILSGGVADADALAELKHAQQRAAESRDDFSRTLAKSGRANPALKATLDPALSVLTARVSDALKTTVEATAGKPDPGRATAFDQSMTQAIDAVFVFNQTALPELGGLLHERVQGLTAGIALIGGALAAMLAAGIAVGWLFARSITAPLAEALTVARAVAAGNLEVPVPVRGSNEIGQLMSALSGMRQHLAEVVGSVRRNAESVALASAEIAAGNADLSSRTEAQAAALEETAASMEELGQTVRSTADNAGQASRLADGASGIAARGGEVVGQVVDTMRGIEESSRRIAEIIGVIDSIAFQTNILALNAAVEAARAGEQGRGFAVVAAEVRSLAHRSADAAREIKELISASAERVSRGTALVDQAGDTMGEVVGAIRRVTEIVGEISTATAEQSSGVSQVGDAVRQMDQSTQQNAALVEQSAAAAESLRAQSRQLVDAVAIFRIRGSER